jgi:hypothetical protein
MVRAVKQNKTKSAKRTSRRKKNPKADLSDLQAIEHVFFRQWRGLFGSERALQHLEDFLRSRPSWHVSASGEVTRVDPEFWQGVALSVEVNT